MKNGLSALPLGGVGEIGMNLMVYECDGDMIIVDVGITFPDEYAPGTDVVLPDINYIRQNIKRLKGIVITHAHEDHIGGLPYLWEDMEAPVYLTKFANHVLQSKLQQMGLENDVPVNVVKPGERIKIGNFDVEYIDVTHSIPEGNAVALRTKYGTIMHTGDYKLDPNPTLGKASNVKRLKEIGDEGVLVMLGDSTNIFKPKDSGSEGAVKESLDKVLAGRKNRVYFCTFASNVGRVKSALELAKKHNRKVALWGYSMKKMLGYARECGYIADDVFNNIIDPMEAMTLPRNKVLILVTGSQAEPRAALSKIANDEINLELAPGDTVLLSSKMIPGNERAIYNLINKLTKQGAEIVHEKSDFVHVSGHAAQDEIAEMYKLIRPQIAVPVHGEYAHLKAHAEFAKQQGVPKQFVIENGTRVYLGPDAPKAVKEENYQFGRMYVDGLNILDEDKYILRERRQMSFHGMVMITAAVDRELGELCDDVTIKTLGIVDHALQPELIQAAVEEATEAAERAIGQYGLDVGKIEEAMRVSVRRLFRIERGRKPSTIATVLEV